MGGKGGCSPLTTIADGVDRKVEKNGQQSAVSGAGEIDIRQSHTLGRDTQLERWCQWKDPNKFHHMPCALRFTHKIEQMWAVASSKEFCQCFDSGWFEQLGENGIISFHTFCE